MGHIFRHPAGRPGFIHYVKVDNWFDTVSKLKLRVYYSKNTMFSRRINMRQRTGLICNWYEMAPALFTTRFLQNINRMPDYAVELD
jgi:hypothetical protein